MNTKEISKIKVQKVKKLKELLEREDGKMVGIVLVGESTEIRINRSIIKEIIAEAIKRERLEIEKELKRLSEDYESLEEERIRLIEKINQVENEKSENKIIESGLRLALIELFEEEKEKSYKRMFKVKEGILLDLKDEEKIAKRLNDLGNERKNPEIEKILEESNNEINTFLLISTSKKINPVFDQIIKVLLHRPEAMKQKFKLKVDQIKEITDSLERTTS